MIKCCYFVAFFIQSSYHCFSSGVISRICAAETKHATLHSGSAANVIVLAMYVAEGFRQFRSVWHLRVEVVEGSSPISNHQVLQEL